MANDISTNNASKGLAFADNPKGIGEIVVPLGTKADGEFLFQDVSQIPHFWVCGYSGTGKTSFVQAMLTYSAMHYSADDVEFLIYDSKSVDYSIFKALPHLIMPIITDDTKVDDIIARLINERKKRLKLLVDSSVKDIFSYNKQCDSTSNKRLPHLFVTLDDFSSIRLDASTIDSLMSILKNGRSIGIHFVLVTSLTSSKAFSKELMSNVPCRISFCVPSKADSRAVIGQEGAESLLVPGEMIYKWQSSLVKCQGAYMADEAAQKEVKKIQNQSKKSVNTLGNMAAQIFGDSSAVDNTLSNSAMNEDPLFSKAVDIALEEGQISTAMLQRQLKLGYARAERLVDALEKHGIIGPYEGEKPRSVIVSDVQQQIPVLGTPDSTNDRKTMENNDKSYDYSADGNITTSNGIKEDDEPEIKMRDFAQFCFNDIGLSVNNNQIEISNDVMTQYGVATTTASFNGNGIAGLTYKKPRLFFPGYIEFVMKPNVKIINNNSDLITVTKDNLSDILRIKFDSNISHTLKLFMTQISQDVGVPLIEL